jgi:Domain of unknown function (DUF4214)
MDPCGQPRTGRRRRIGALVMAILGSLLALWHAAHAAEFACAAGDVACLIAAIHAANANGEVNTITLAAGTYSLTTVDNTSDGPTGLPSITSTLTIRGAGAERTTIARAAGAPQFRLVHVAAASPLTLEGLTLRGGDIAISSRVFSGSGGGLYNRGGTVLLTYSTLAENQAVRGGGIATSGTVFVISSTLTGNAASSLGGGGLLVNAGATVIVSHSTVAENQAKGGPAAGIYNTGGTVHLTASTVAENTGLFAAGIWNSSGTVTLTNSTLADNRASGASVPCSGVGGLCNGSGTVTLQNTILARNTSLQSGPDCQGLITSQGTNVLGDLTGCSITLQSSDIIGDPGMGAFADASVPGHGHVPLLPESPAMDAANPAVCPATDQLGRPREGVCDIGAIEFQPTLAAFVTGFYQDALGRAPSPAEVADWMGFLQADPTVTRASAMVHAFFDGLEYRARPVTPWEHVAALYQAILGREPEAEGEDWWVGVLLDRLNTALPLFLASPEFQQLVPDCRDAASVMALVTRLSTETLGRTPSPEDVLSWTQYLVTTCDLEGTVEAFFTAEAYLRVPRTLADHVTILYRALLARAPTAEEEMLWVDYLTGQLARLEDGFIESAEFQARWQQLFP